MKRLLSIAIAWMLTISQYVGVIARYAGNAVGQWWSVRIEAAKRGMEMGALQGARFMCRDQLINGQTGTINLSNIMLLGIGMVFMGIGAYFIPVMLDGFVEALSADNVSDFTGLSSILGLAPTIIVLGFVVAGGITGFMGIKGIVRG